MKLKLDMYDIESLCLFYWNEAEYFYTVQFFWKQT